MLLAYDTFNEIPRHVAARDVGCVGERGELVSLKDAGEFYLLTEWAPGTLYADDLRRLARDRRVTAVDRLRAERLARYLAELHADRGGNPDLYRRAIRDAVGHGEGIFGLVDSFPAGVPGAPLARLYALERAASTWREKLRGKERRLSVVHGDFHPFNILFADDGEPRLLDAARGCRGDPADDAVCLALNYVFFALGHPGAWQGGLAELWERFWTEYLRITGDRELLEIAPLYLAWRSLVMVHPAWYPSMTEAARDALLSFVERALAAGRLDPERAGDVFR
jgi:aminoglycoside phosphotransferase (APT) family kinase protein